MGYGVARTKLAGQGFFAKAMIRATGRDGGETGGTGIGGFLEVAYSVSIKFCTAKPPLGKSIRGAWPRQYY
jgi:hypothetical protein